MIFNYDNVFNEGAVARTSKITVLVDLDQNRNYGNAAYFKVADSGKLSSRTGISRIRFFEPEYEPHAGNITLDRKQKQELMKLLKSRGRGIVILCG